MAEPNGEAESVEPLCQLLSGTRLQPAAEAAAEEESLVGGLSVLVGDLWAPRHVARVSRRLTALEFYRDYVSTSLPCIFTPQAGLLQHWSALYRWQNWGYLKAKAGQVPVTVNVTPNGKGDAVLHTPHGRVFVKPEERVLPFHALIDALGPQPPPTHDTAQAPPFVGVPYLSQQNDSLRVELPVLLEDVDAQGLSLGNEAFNNTPEAVNLWVGDERSVSSLHKDHYDNLYCVVTGQKHFLLFPPSDVSLLPEAHHLPQARYHHNPVTQSWDVEMEPSEPPLSWLLHPAEDHGHVRSEEEGERLRLLHPVECVVNPGEVLYLPALWFHRVTQTEPTIAVNYWYDMPFDCKYVYFKFLQDMARRQHPPPLPPTPPEAGDTAAQSTDTLLHET